MSANDSDDGLSIICDWPMTCRSCRCRCTSALSTGTAWRRCLPVYRNGVAPLLTGLPERRGAVPYRSTGTAWRRSLPAGLPESRGTVPCRNGTTRRRSLSDAGRAWSGWFSTAVAGALRWCKALKDQKILREVGVSGLFSTGFSTDFVSIRSRACGMLP